MKLIMTKPALKDLAKLDKTTQKQIGVVLDKYITGGQVDILKLSGKSLYRIRSGDFRISIEQATESSILVYALRVLNQRDAYR